MNLTKRPWQRMSDPLDVLVIGSCMIDLVCYAPRLPKSGETLCGSKFQMGFGGKGCNQCVAAKKLGANSQLVARIGNDTFGKNYFDKLKGYGIPTNLIKITDGVSTGMAQITVADTGENQIVIVMGANEKLTENDVQEVKDVIKNCKILLCQMEINETSTIEALKLKSLSRKGKSIFNCAPAKSNLNPLLFSLPDIFCVNELEAETLTGVEVTDLTHAKKAAKIFLDKGCKEIIITLGKQGALYGKQGRNEFDWIPAFEVNAIDTTGAGDAFLGALAFYLATQPNLTMKVLIEKANGIAAISVQRLGTQDSFPTIPDLPPELKV